MNRIAYRIVSGCLAAAIGIATIGSAAAADAKSKTGQVRAKSSLSAQAPLLGRIVVVPSPEQMAKIRRERRMMELENRAADSKTVGSIHPHVTEAL